MTKPIILNSPDAKLNDPETVLGPGSCEIVDGIPTVTIMAAPPPEGWRLLENRYTDPEQAQHYRHHTDAWVMGHSDQWVYAGGGYIPEGAATDLEEAKRLALASQATGRYYPELDISDLTLGNLTTGTGGEEGR